MNLEQRQALARQAHLKASQQLAASRLHNAPKQEAIDAACRSAQGVIEAGGGVLQDFRNELSALYERLSREW